MKKVLVHFNVNEEGFATLNNLTNMKVRFKAGQDVVMNMDEEGNLFYDSNIIEVAREREIPVTFSLQAAFPVIVNDREKMSYDVNNI